MPQKQHLLQNCHQPLPLLSKLFLLPLLRNPAPPNSCLTRESPVQGLTRKEKREGEEAKLGEVIAGEEVEVVEEVTDLTLVVVVRVDAEEAIIARRNNQRLLPPQHLKQRNQR
jgi:hypothetical protein